MKRILVVDDEPTLVATVKYNLEREGYQVVTAADGESGLSVARAERPDLVILDLMLPGLDGFEVCRILRRETTAPILMLTAKTEEVDKVVGLELGADDYVTKPFSMRELLARVRALLRRAEVPAAEAAVLIAAIAPTSEPLSSGEHVFSKWLMTAIHEGEFAGLPPTGKRFELRGVSVLLTGGKKIVRAADCFDVAGFVRQVAPEREWGSNSDRRSTPNPWLCTLADEDNIGYGE